MVLADGLELRAYTADDVAAVVEAVNGDLDHLRPWMPWAQVPVTEEAQREWLHGVLAAWDEAREFVYGIFRGTRLVGAIGLHARRGPGVLEIGYWLRADEEGRGTVTAAARALSRVAVVAGAERVEIRCDEANTRSASVPRRLGFTLDAVEERAIEAPAETGWHQVWSISAEAVRSG